MSFLLHSFHCLIHIAFTLCFSPILSITHLSILIQHFILQFTEFYISQGFWVRWQCWLSVQSWWRGWWSPGPSAKRGPTKFGYVKTGHGPQCWWTTCCPAMIMATSSSPRSETERDVQNPVSEDTLLMSERLYGYCTRNTGKSDRKKLIILFNACPHQVHRGWSRF